MNVSVALYVYDIYVCIIQFGKGTCGMQFIPCKIHNKTDCLDKNFVCDGVWDCDDGEDEKKELHQDNPICQSILSTCKPDEFQCQDGECIEESKHCDKSTDCADASDEMDGDCGMYFQVNLISLHQYW